MHLGFLEASLATAENAYYESLVEYNKQIANLHYRKGTLLDSYNVYLAEGSWEPVAYRDAERRARKRTNALSAKWKHAEPTEHALPDLNGAAQQSRDIIQRKSEHVTNPPDAPMDPLPPGEADTDIDKGAAIRHEGAEPLKLSFEQAEPLGI